MKLLKTLPWLGASRWTSSWTITNSPSSRGRSNSLRFRVQRFRGTCYRAANWIYLGQPVEAATNLMGAGVKPAITPVKWHDAEDIRWAVRHWAARIGVGVKAPQVYLQRMHRKWASVSTAGGERTPVFPAAAGDARIGFASRAAGAGRSAPESCWPVH